jgi:hypothetical protein
VPKEKSGHAKWESLARTSTAIAQQEKFGTDQHNNCPAVLMQILQLSLRTISCYSAISVPPIEIERDRERINLTLLEGIVSRDDVSTETIDV